MAMGRFIAVLYVLGVIQCLGDRIVASNAGTFRGLPSSEGQYDEFLGIPYGQVNSENPFGVATAYPAISGIYDAVNDTGACPQMDGDGNYIGDLDCLHLNIFVPNNVIDVVKLPVMVFIHGGFFSQGSATKDTFGPRFLVRHGIILVVINYRLGPYGFMCLNRRAVPGNQGLKDQALALKWIRNNIEAFGGDSNQVTLYGMSAGAHSVDLHLLSEQELLFDKVILQSGSSLAATVIYEPDREAHIKIASYLGLEYETSAEALSALSQASPEDIIRATSHLNIIFKPCAETEFAEVEPFITKYWIDSPTPKAQGMPIMVGFTEYETMMIYVNANAEYFQGLENLIYDYLNQTFDFDAERLRRMEKYVRRFYFGDNPMIQDVNLGVINWDVMNIQSDFVYNHAIQRSIKKFVEAQAANIFYYLFTYSGERNVASISNQDIVKASHADDMRYIFDMSNLPAEISEEDQLMIDRMTTMWANFAKHGDPTPASTTLLPERWISLTGDIYHYLKIDSNFTMERRPFSRRSAFWDLFYKLNYDYQRRFEAADFAPDDDSGSTLISNNLMITFIIVLLLAVIK